MQMSSIFPFPFVAVTLTIHKKKCHSNKGKGELKKIVFADTNNNLKTLVVL